MSDFTAGMLHGLEAILGAMRGLLPVLSCGGVPASSVMLYATPTGDRLESFAIQLANGEEADLASVKGVRLVERNRDIAIGAPSAWEALEVSVAAADHDPQRFRVASVARTVDELWAVPPREPRGLYLTLRRHHPGHEAFVPRASHLLSQLVPIARELPVGARSVLAYGERARDVSAHERLAEVVLLDRIGLDRTMLISAFQLRPRHSLCVRRLGSDAIVITDTGGPAGEVGLQAVLDLAMPEVD